MTCRLKKGDIPREARTSINHCYSVSDLSVFHSVLSSIIVSTLILRMPERESDCTYKDPHYCFDICVCMNMIEVREGGKVGVVSVR
jgi:hypothetical protein